MTRLSLAALAAEAAPTGSFEDLLRLLDTFLNSLATITILTIVGCIWGAKIISRSISDLAKAIRESAKPSSLDMKKLIEQVLERVRGEIDRAAGTADEALGHVGTLYDNDAALESGLNEVAEQTGADVTVKLAGLDWMRNGNSPAPEGATWASPADIAAAHAAMLRDDQTIVADERRNSHRGAPALPELPASNLPFNPADPDSIMGYVTKLSIEQYGAYPWRYTDDDGEIRYYDRLRPKLEQSYGVPLPKTFDLLWAGLSRDTRVKFESLTASQQ